MDNYIENLNSQRMKSFNQKQILNFLSIKPCSRAALSILTGLTKAAISKIIDDMIRAGILVEVKNANKKAGRNPIVLYLNPRLYRIGFVSLERDFYHVGLTDFSGKMLTIERIIPAPDDTAHQIMDELIAILSDMLSKTRDNGPLLGIGIVAPGPLDQATGVIVNPPNFKIWEGAEIVSHFKKSFDCQVLLENNAKAMAMAEYRYYLHGDYKSFLELYVGAGIGGGLFLENKIYRGCTGNAGEFGHISLNMHGPKCSCGNFGCAEMYASIPQITRYAQELNEKYDTWQAVVDDAVSGVPGALRILEAEAGYIAALLTTASNSLDIEAVVLSGDIAYKGALICEMIQKAVNSHLIFRSALPVLLTKLSSMQQIITGANLVIENYLMPGGTPAEAAPAGKAPDHRFKSLMTRSFYFL